MSNDALFDYEVVANVSEGRDSATIARLSSAISETPGVRLLDVHADPDHDRSVFTYVAAGDAEIAGTALLKATVRLADIAVQSIDLRKPEKSGSGRGVHPRIGALDVVPVVPVSDCATIEGAVAVARRIAEALGARGISVHCYAEAARSEDRRSLATIRSGEFEGLAERQRAANGAPDFGPSTPHATAGGVAVGARSPMVAWNIELLAQSPESALSAARAVSRAIRASAGGANAVSGLQALGFSLRSRRSAQVSMNLHGALDAAARGDTLHAIRAKVALLASAYGAELGETEIVGLVHERILRAGGDPGQLKIRGGWERAVLERR